MRARIPLRTVVSFTITLLTVAVAAATLAVVRLPPASADRPATSRNPASERAVEPDSWRLRRSDTPEPGVPPTRPTRSASERPVEPTSPQSHRAPASLRAGDQGRAVLALQERLAHLGYWPGTADGTFAPLTTHAVLAFQKAQELERDGVVGPATRAALDAAKRRAPRTTQGHVIELDLARQLLLVVDDGQVAVALHTATGALATPTPPGSFVIYREIDGWRHAPLGTLYRPKYFNGGIAIHGSPNLPPHPASHGCARVSNAAMDMLWASGMVEIGVPVVVY